VLADKSRTKRPRNTKIGGNVVYLTGNNAHQFQGQTGHRSRSAAGRLMLRLEVCHMFRTERPAMNFKLGVQMEHEDPYRRDGQSLARSTVKVAMSRGASDRCWLITKSPRNIEIGK